MEILFCKECHDYTLNEFCPRCNKNTLSPKPAKFSLEDKYGVYRRRAKRSQ